MYDSTEVFHAKAEGLLLRSLFLNVSLCILYSFIDVNTKFSVFVENSCIGKLNEYYNVPGKHKYFTGIYLQSICL